MKARSEPTTEVPPTLADMGITKDQSSRYQSLASMSEAHFETAVATAKDTAGEVTTAFMLRTASGTVPAGQRRDRRTPLAGDDLVKRQRRPGKHQQGGIF